MAHGKPVLREIGVARCTCMGAISEGVDYNTNILVRAFPNQDKHAQAEKGP